MALTPSSMLALGTLAPDFALPDVVSGQTLGLQELKSSKATVIMFICNHCPYVKFIQVPLARLAAQYSKQGVSFAAINSNDAATHPQDGPGFMKLEAEKFGYVFPYLFDETQQVAKAYQATCTPDFFVFDKDLKLAYRGQFDDARPGNNQEPTGLDLKLALDNFLQGKEPNTNQKPSVGCNIKWRN
jgi:thiol-disulfide isomerase/thioredoxin